MALVSGGRSTLNPNAPLFVPAAFRQVEDFSPEWWQLVTTSTWYHDYWLSQHQGEDGFYDNAANDFEGNDIADLLPDTFDFGAAEDFSNMEAQYEEFIQYTEIEKENKSSQFSSYNFQGNGDDTMKKSLATLNSWNERSPKSLLQAAKYAEKPAKFVNPKYSPRSIQQPR